MVDNIFYVSAPGVSQESWNWKHYDEDIESWNRMESEIYNGYTDTDQAYNRKKHDWGICIYKYTIEALF